MRHYQWSLDTVLSARLDVNDVALREWLAVEHRDRHASDDEPPDGPPDRRPGPNRARLLRLLDRLPSVEQDVLRLVLRGYKQEVIASLIGSTQQTVSFKIATATTRLRWLASLPEIPTGPEAERDLTALLPRRAGWATTVRMLVGVIETLNVAAAARRCGVRQQAGRERLPRAVAALRASEDQRAWRYGRFFESVCSRRSEMARVRGERVFDRAPRRRSAAAV